MFKRALVIGCSLLLAWPGLTQTETPEDYLNPKLNHDDFGFVPQPQSPEDYTQGSVRLGIIPGQDLVREFRIGDAGQNIGDLKPVKPANSTISALTPGLPQKATTRQTVGLDRDPETGLPTDVNGRTISPISRGTTTRQTVGLVRNPRTGLPTDVLGRDTPH